LEKKSPNSRPGIVTKLPKCLTSGQDDTRRPLRRNQNVNALLTGGPSQRKKKKSPQHQIGPRSILKGGGNDCKKRTGRRPETLKKGNFMWGRSLGKRDRLEKNMRGTSLQQEPNKSPLSKKKKRGGNPGFKNCEWSLLTDSCFNPEKETI